jgi:hypothetical protein
MKGASLCSSALQSRGHLAQFASAKKTVGTALISIL